MVNCERCGNLMDGGYGSGRFCSSKCARSFSSKEKRQEINQKVSKKLKGRKAGPRVNAWRFQCEKCSRKFRKQEAKDAHRMHCIYGGPKRSEEGLKRCGWTRGLTRADERVDRMIRSREVPDSILFVKDTPQNSTNAKKRYYKRTPNVCETCGQGDNWNGKFLRLQIDHKNGDSSDNRWENLRKVCPNCHTQTDTFSWRNVRIKKIARVVELTDTPVLEAGPGNRVGV